MIQIVESRGFDEQTLKDLSQYTEDQFKDYMVAMDGIRASRYFIDGLLPFVIPYLLIQIRNDTMLVVFKKDYSTSWLRDFK